LVRIDLFPEDRVMSLARSVILLSLMKFSSGAFKPSRETMNEPGVSALGFSIEKIRQLATCEMAEARKLE
jgi:hypothetical protein